MPGGRKEGRKHRNHMRFKGCPRRPRAVDSTSTSPSGSTRAPPRVARVRAPAASSSKHRREVARRCAAAIRTQRLGRREPESNVRRVATLRAARQDERAKRCRCLHLGVLALVAVLCASDATAFATHAVCGKRGGSLCVGEGTAPSPRAFWARAVTVLSSVSASTEAR